MKQEDLIRRRAKQRGCKAVFHDGLCDLVPMAAGVLSWKDAPLDDVTVYLCNPLWKTAEKKLWDGLSLDTFDLIGCFRGPRGPVLAMRSRRAGDPAPWCCEYKGSGQYFRDFGSLAVYISARFGGRRLTGRRYSDLMRRCREHRETGVPLAELLALPVDRSHCTRA